MNALAPHYVEPAYVAYDDAVRTELRAQALPVLWGALERQAQPVATGGGVGLFGLLLAALGIAALGRRR